MAQFIRNQNHNGGIMQKIRLVGISKSLFKEIRRSWRKNILGKNPIGRPRKKRAKNGK